MCRIYTIIANWSDLEDQNYDYFQVSGLEYK